MRIVSSSSSSDKDLERERARQTAESALVVLTGNLLRIVRGAGRPYDLHHQIVELAEAYRSHKDVFHFWPGEMEGALALPDVWRSGLPFDQLELEAAKQVIVRGALQMAASEILGQRTQRTAGQSEMYDGIRAVERAHEERRRKWAESAQAGRNSRAAAPAADARAAVRGSTKKRASKQRGKPD